MNTAAIYHRPDSEFAYLYSEEEVYLRLRVAKNDMKKVEIVYGDPYEYERLGWWREPVEMIKLLSTEDFDYYQIIITADHKRLAYFFKLYSETDESILYTDRGIFSNEEENLKDASLVFKFPYFHEEDRVKNPDWVKSTVWYQIFPERFANGDRTNDPKNVKEWNPKESPKRQDYYGGDLQGVLDHLDHFISLGINGLYFTPIFKAGSNHKYDTVDYLEIDPDFGDKELFKKIVKECHQRGIKVMLDAVFNHIGDLSPYWQDVLKNQKKSKYANWFHVNNWPVHYTETEDFEYTADASYDTFAFTPHMPKWNTSNPEVIDYLLNVASYWIKEFDIDAWRLDVANEVDHQFWKKFRKICDQTKKDFYIVGEIWHNSQSWLNGDEFSSVMNYAYTQAILDGCIKSKISLEKMASKMNEQLMLYRKQTNQVMLNSLDSHDTARLLTLCEGNKDLFKLVYAFNFLQIGLPMIYYGDEFSLTGANDPDCRKCMPWKKEEQDLEMFTFFQSLIQFRKENFKEISEAQLNWEFIEERKKRFIISIADIKAVFNLGQEDWKLETGKILLSHNFRNHQLKAEGFVIYK
ncbi:MAG: glycoside hydrolase family 13 protein [Lactovum sp.]